MESTKTPRLLDRVRDRCRTKHYSYRTEQSYTHWIRRFFLFHGKRHPETMGAAEVESFLTDLAVSGNVAASTQNQALAAILFLYRQGLDIELPWLENITRAKRSPRVPVLLRKEETLAVLAHLDGSACLVTRLMYGSGLRLMEALRLRIKDVDFSRKEITVRDGKRGKDRRTVLPISLIGPLREEVARVEVLLARDIAEGTAPVQLPHALGRK